MILCGKKIEIIRKANRGGGAGRGRRGRRRIKRQRGSGRWGWAEQRRGVEGGGQEEGKAWNPRWARPPTWCVTYNLIYLSVSILQVRKFEYFTSQCELIEDTGFEHIWFPFSSNSGWLIMGQAWYWNYYNYRLHLVPFLTQLESQWGGWISDCTVTCRAIRAVDKGVRGRIQGGSTSNSPGIRENFLEEGASFWEPKD